jgi:hypothetical protein
MKRTVVGLALALMLPYAVPTHAHNPESESRFRDARIRGNAQTGAVADVTSVSEPSSIWMLGSGLVTLAGIGLIRRANRRNDLPS